MNPLFSAIVYMSSIISTIHFLSVSNTLSVLTLLDILLTYETVHGDFIPFYKKTSTENPLITLVHACGTIFLKKFVNKKKTIAKFSRRFSEHIIEIILV